MQTGSKSKISMFNLTVQNGQYPFKNNHIRKFFDLKVKCTTSRNPQIVNKIVQSFRKFTHPFLMHIENVENLKQGKTILTYQYIDTQLAQYIKFSRNENIQLKLQKLYIELRNLASSLVLRNINVLNAISSNNIGVRYSQFFRQSLSPTASNKNRKQIQLPEFKIYLHLDHCEIIQNQHEVARVLIQIDKLIYNKISTQINAIVANAEKQPALTTHEKFATFKSLIFTGCDEQKISKNKQFLTFTMKGQQKLQNLQFTNKIKRRKRERKGDKKWPTHIRANTERKMEKKSTEEDDSLSYQQQIKSILSHNVSDLDKEELSSQIQHILQKSKRTLNTFKLLIGKCKQK